MVPGNSRSTLGVGIVIAFGIEKKQLSEKKAEKSELFFHKKYRQLYDILNRIKD